MTNKFKKVANLLGIKEWQARELIRGSLKCKVTTIKEARYYYMVASPDSKAEKAALLKWIEFCTTIKEIKVAYNAAFPDVETGKVALLKWIELCVTIEEIKGVYDAASMYSEIQKVAINKVYKLI
jgi:hypothetical protein